MKKAFTMIELVFVIVVVGILAVAIIPSIKTNPLQEAAIQLLSDIRYTQHLAMIDDKYDSGDASWYKRRWQLLFGTSTNYTNGFEAYSIFSDSGAFSGNPGISELAKNPQSHDKLMTGGYAGVIDYETDSRVTRKMNLGASFGVTSVTATCGGKRVAFDYLGRPLAGDISNDSAPYISSGRTSSLLSEDCSITLSDGSDSIKIRITPETGFACILNTAGTDCI